MKTLSQNNPLSSFSGLIFTAHAVKLWKTPPTPPQRLATSLGENTFVSFSSFHNHLSSYSKIASIAPASHSVTVLAPQNAQQPRPRPHVTQYLPRNVRHKIQTVAGLLAPLLICRGVAKGGKIGLCAGLK